MKAFDQFRGMDGKYQVSMEFSIFAPFDSLAKNFRIDLSRNLSLV